MVRHFPSLWAAIFENAISRIWLGVHWRFDAFAAKDVLIEDNSNPISPHKIENDGTTSYKDPHSIRYKTTGTRMDRPNEQFPIGGVPLGIGIANDIFQGKLKPTPPSKQPIGRDKCGLDDLMEDMATDTVTPRLESIQPKSTPTNIR